MTTYVLVHGAGRGGWVYDRVRRLLEAEGHTVFRPTLTGVGERVHLLSPDVDLGTHIADVINVLFYEGLRDVVLVGHSYGGYVTTAVADRAGDRIDALVYLDTPPAGARPQHGQTILDGLPLLQQFKHPGAGKDGVELGFVLDQENPEPVLEAFGVTDPEDVEWMRSRLRPHPWKSIEQPLALHDETSLNAIPQFHVVSNALIDTVEPDLLSTARAEGRFWHIDTGHDLMITSPEAVAQVLIEIGSDRKSTRPRLTAS